MNGLRELGDPRGYDVALAALSNKRLPRWWLGTPTWDYPIPAVHTIVALGKGDTVFPLLLDRFEKSLEDNDYNDIFSNVLLIADLGDPRGKGVFESLKKRFEKDTNAMTSVKQFESRFQSRLKANKE